MVKNPHTIPASMPRHSTDATLPLWVGIHLFVFILGGCAGCVLNDQDSHIRGLIQDLGDAPLGVISLGAARPAKSTTTDRLISYGGKAVPLLVQALASENPVQVGYAAYCLREIGASRGISEAESAARRLQALQTKTVEVRFALTELEAFLSSAKGG